MFKAPRFSLVHIFLLVSVCAFCCSPWSRFEPSEVPIRSGRELDFGIFGRGYFPIIAPNGRELYTRIGRFEANADGAITPCPDHLSLEGWTLSCGLIVPGGCQAIRVASDGMVSAKDSDGRRITVGSFSLCRFENPDGLDEVMPGIYGATEKSGAPVVGEPGQVGLGYLQQGWIESNYSLFRYLREFTPFATLVGLAYLILVVRSNSLTINEMRDQMKEPTGVGV